MDTIERVIARFPRIPWWFKLSWRKTKVLPILFVIELPITIAGLALYGIADPDTYRTILWQEGSNNGWNSDPSELLYAYANYRPMSAPAPWNSFITQFNVIVSVLSLFVLIVKCVMYIGHLFPPIVSFVVHAAVLSLWLVSISQQAGSDYSDPNFPSQFPWYLTRGCGAPVSGVVQGYCRQAIGAFVVAVVMSCLFLIYLVFSIKSAFPTAEQKRQAEEEAAEDEDLESTPITYQDDKHFEYEMDFFARDSKSPTFAAVPMTPRTQAFNALEGKKVGKKAKVQAKSPPLSPQSNRDLPLRHHISMGEETYGKVSYA